MSLFSRNSDPLQVALGYGSWHELARRPWCGASCKPRKAALSRSVSTDRHLPVAPRTSQVVAPPVEREYARGYHPTPLGFALRDGGSKYQDLNGGLRMLGAL